MKRRFFEALWLAAMIVVMIVSGIYIAAAQSSPQTTFRDAGGRTIGTATTNNGGSGVTTTFRDAGGRTTGTATTTSGGLTTYRDAGGRTTGTSTGPRR
jgi:hypothetical protein